jgi:PGF-pre-PGF domain-containing protein
MRILRVGLVLLAFAAIAGNASAMVVTISLPEARPYGSGTVPAAITTDEAAAWCGYSLNGAAYQGMANSSETHWTGSLASLPEGQSSVTFACNDTGMVQFVSPPVQFSVDTIAPAITGVGNGTAGTNRTEILWTTDEGSDSVVFYGRSLPPSVSSGLAPAMATSHDVLLDALENKTTYYYYVRSCDAAGNCNQSAVRNFTTRCQEDWEYGHWGECYNNLQVRPANDRNRCGTMEERLAIYRQCVQEPVEIVEVRGRSVTWESLEPNVTKRLVMDESGLDVIEVSFQSSRRENWTSIRVASLSGKPLGLPDPPGIVSQYVNITTEGIDYGYMSSGKVLFRVARSWLVDVGVARESVRLLRFNGTWAAMPTRMTGYNDVNAFYESDVPGFSVFAMGGETGSGPALCVPAQKACNGNVLQECSEWGESLNETECSYGCSNETLSCIEEAQAAGVQAPQQPSGCTPDAARCAGNDVMLCNSPGTGEMKVESCPSGCADGKCLSGNNAFAYAAIGTACLLGLALARKRRRRRKPAAEGKPIQGEGGKEEPGPDRPEGGAKNEGDEAGKSGGGEAEEEEETDEYGRKSKRKKVTMSHF